MSDAEIQRKIAQFSSIEEALDYFEIGYEPAFISEYRTPLVKRFNGYLIMVKPEDWFAARRCLKSAYCKIQRSRLDPHSRSACRGCTTCQRR
ncbi:nitrogenase-stabilizing/protective protein NifW [Vibrio coralliilyticus]|uniref:nitrogenase-stabilizing/protective protein NifW n=1 Tax=Vibrio coralliilyticus TaxID=190893 RepID=UPI0015608CDB|nr:nitrogenase-stabilizing/protective protein NifW [Vibrio coralliilyticus]NRF13726.1 nitrogen fixation protein NifW [Vibrio coralliilyticus]